MKAEVYFAGKGCVVTGAASGIGLALSKGLLQAGATVFMADREAGRLAEAVGELSAPVSRVMALTVDVTDQSQVKEMIEEAAGRYGRLDVLCNNAGIGCTMPIGEATLEHWRRVVDINLWSVIYGIDAALPIMRRQGGGHIVNTASISGLLPIPYQAIYAATKYAVVGISESLRFELEEEGIHFSVACPGNVATRIFGKQAPEDAISAEEAAETILAGVARQEGIIVLPEAIRRMWREYWSVPEAGESFLRQMARERRQKFQTTGSYY